LTVSRLSLGGGAVAGLDSCQTHRWREGNPKDAPYTNRWCLLSQTDLFLIR